MKRLILLLAALSLTGCKPSTPAERCPSGIIKVDHIIAVHYRTAVIRTADGGVGSMDQPDAYPDKGVCKNNMWMYNDVSGLLKLYPDLYSTFKTEGLVK